MVDIQISLKQCIIPCIMCAIQYNTYYVCNVLYHEHTSIGNVEQQSLLMPCTSLKWSNGKIVSLGLARDCVHFPVF